MHPYLKPLQIALKERTNPENAEAMKSYMQNRFEFYGVKTPLRREITRDFFRRRGLPTLEELPLIVEELWQQAQREYQYIGLDLLRRIQRHLKPGHIRMLEQLILNKSWWDTVDMLAGRNIGGLLLKFPELRGECIPAWAEDDNFWLRRTTLLFQLHYKQETDADLLFDLIRRNLGSREFFINKAIGWALREYSKTAAETVIAFIEKTELSPLSRREALKWLQNQSSQ